MFYADFKNEKGFIGLIGLILTALIACFLLYLAMENYGSGGVGVTPTTVGQSGQSAGPATGDYASVLQSATGQIKAIEKQQQESADQILRDMQGGLTSP